MLQETRATPEHMALLIGIAQLPALLATMHGEVRRWHTQRGVSYVTIAAGCGLHRNTIAHWLAHPEEATVGTLLAIAEWLRRQSALLP